MGCAHLHANDAVDEKDETNKNGNPRQGLEGFDESPEESSDALTLTQQFHEPHDTEETEEVNGDHVPSRLQKNSSKRKG